ncbi:low temperature requirement protein LtrA [Conyzicola nivalis]|uniref:Low temperature requirement protein LtrA n=1 Tax=Conyzicola nivalis TaxID=1477021 RepID=A0ABV2QQV6_9MICO
MPSLITRMTARDTTQAHRPSSPLELLFDLVFVVAIAQVAVQLAHAIAEGHVVESLAPYCMVFFAIWWAWMNFTWFASAYDTDDVPYRILVLVQMAGVLILAADVPSAFSGGGFTAVTIGYLVMRVGLVSLWVRAGIQHPQGRATAFRYAAGITVVQILWVSRLAFPDSSPWWFLVIALADLSVPLWAERTGKTAWHPHHIAERYGLFTIIVLGESVLASTLGVQDSLDGGGLSAELVVIALAGLTLLFVLWWLYFSEPAGDGLERRRNLSFVWGYGHYVTFAALAAVGAGLEVAVESAGHHTEVTDQVVAFAIGVPVAIFLVMLWAVHAPIVDRVVINPVAILVSAVVIVLLPLSAPAIGVAGALVAMVVVLVALLASALVVEARR